MRSGTLDLFDLASTNDGICNWGGVGILSIYLESCGYLSATSYRYFRNFP